MGSEDGRRPLQGAGRGAGRARRGDPPRLPQARQGAAPRPQSGQSRLGRGAVQEGLGRLRDRRRPREAQAVRPRRDRRQRRAAARLPARTMPAAARSAAGRGGRPDEEFGFGDIFSDLFGARAARRRCRRPVRGARPRCALHAGDRFPGGRHRRQEARDACPTAACSTSPCPRAWRTGRCCGSRARARPACAAARPATRWSRSRCARIAQFKRAGDDIVLELPITIDEAVLGAKIEVPTVSGRVQLTIPKGTSSGRVFRLKGKGVRNTDDRQHRRSARHRAHRPARHHRRQARLLHVRVAPDAPLRPRPVVSASASATCGERVRRRALAHAPPSARSGKPSLPSRTGEKG